MAIGNRFGGTFLAGAALSALATVLAAPAVAQSTPPTGTPTLPQEQTTQQPAGEQTPGTPGASAGDTAVAPGNGIADIVVTATRRETNLQSTPISISVLNTQALTDRHVLSLFNLADGTIPSLRVATFEARQSALTIGIRGIVPYDQNQTARDGGVGVYIDGIALGKTQGLNAALFDIERIEVLKGPQGTLFGRNTEGGALSLVTKAPSGVFDGRIVAGVGNYGGRNAEIHLDLPSFADISFKIDGVYQHQNPTVRNPLAGATGWNYYDRKGGRIAARWQPIEGFTADLAYDYAKDENSPNYSQLVNYNPNNFAVGTFVNTAAAGAAPVFALYTAPGGVVCGGTIAAASTRPVCIAPKAPLVGVHPERQRVADVGVPQQPSSDITHGVSANLRYKIAPAIELRSITAWRGVNTEQWDNSGGPERSSFAPNTNFSRYSLSFFQQHQFSQELQAVGSIPQFDYVVGAYYYTENANEFAATPLTNTFNADGTNYTIRSPIVTGTISGQNSGYQPGSRFITRNSQAFDHNYSVFGNLTFTPAGLDVIHLTAGGRYTKDKRHGRLFVVNNLATNFSFRNEVNRFDPLLNLAVDATPDVHLYAKYATGFRAGGANDRSQQFNAFGPEAVKSYEIGAKMDFLDHRARLNLAGYIMNRSNTQFDFDQFDTTAGSPTSGAHIEQTQNAGRSKIRGIEADLTVKPIPALTLTGAYAYTYVKAPSAVNPLTGGLPQQLYIVYTPKHAASGAIDYAIPVAVDGASIRLHLDANYASSQYSFQLEPTKTDSSFIVNGRIALADIAVNDHNKVTISAWSRNLLNKTYIYRRSAANSSPTLNFNGATLVSTSYGGILGDYANYNPPRTYGIELAAKF